MSSIITFGLSEIAVGAVAADGGIGTSLVKIGNTKEDSCKFTTDDPTETPYMAEEYDDPMDIVYIGGKSVLTFAIMDADPDTLSTLMGGTTAGTPKEWGAPDVAVFGEKSIRVTPKKGLILTIPRALLFVKWTGDFSKKGLMVLEAQARVLQPTKAGVARYYAKAQS